MNEMHINSLISIFNLFSTDFVVLFSRNVLYNHLFHLLNVNTQSEIQTLESNKCEPINLKLSSFSRLLFKNILLFLFHLKNKTYSILFFSPVVSPKLSKLIKMNTKISWGKILSLKRKI
jgi:hypothetical protein